MLKLWQKYFWWFWGGMLIIALVTGAVLVGRPVYQLVKSYQNFLSETQIQPHEFAGELVAGVQDGFTNSLDDEILFLILGVDSLDGDVSSNSHRDVLTDTIILANLDLSEQTINLLSLPRDIYLPEAGYKINEIYNQARLKGASDPQTATTDYLSGLIGEKIDYTLVFTFDQVREMIDAIGGIKIDVERSFTDELYPTSYEEIYLSNQTASSELTDYAHNQETENLISDKSLSSAISPYETVSFEAGEQLMDGATTLKYMRSRHAVGEEGNDLARAARQQKVIDAFSNQIISQLFDGEKADLNWSAMAQLYNLYQTNFASDLSPRTLAQIFTQVLRVHYQAEENLSPEQLQDSDQLSAYLTQVENNYWNKVESGELTEKSLTNWQFYRESLGVQPDDPEGILREATPYEQRRFYNGAWVWVVTDWKSLPEVIKTKLNLE